MEVLFVVVMRVLIYVYVVVSINVPIYVYVFLLLYGSMVGFDAWNVFVRSFQDFKQLRLKFEIVIF